MKNLVPLKKLIKDNFSKESGKFFYSFEVSPRQGFQVDFKKLHIQPLFVDITWISDHNLKYKQIRSSPAFELKNAIKSSVNVVNSITCYNLQDDHIDQILQSSENEVTFNLTILRGGK